MSSCGYGDLRSGGETLEVDEAFGVGEELGAASPLKPADEPAQGFRLTFRPSRQVLIQKL